MVLLFFKCTKCFIVITTCRVIILCSWYVCVFMCFCAVKSAQCISMLSDLRSRPRSHRRVLNTHPNVGWLDLDFVCCPVSSGLCTSSWGFKFAWEVWRVKVGQVSQWEYFCFSFFFFFLRSVPKWVPKWVCVEMSGWIQKVEMLTLGERLQVDDSFCNLVYNCLVCCVWLQVNVYNVTNVTMSPLLSLNQLNKPHPVCWAVFCESFIFICLFIYFTFIIIMSCLDIYHKMAPTEQKSSSWQKHCWNVMEDQINSYIGSSKCIIWKLMSNCIFPWYGEDFFFSNIDWTHNIYIYFFLFVRLSLSSNKTHCRKSH